MKQVAMLSDVQSEEVRRLARDKRQSLGFIGESPIAKGIFTILDQLGVMLLEYPIGSESSQPALSAAMIYLEEGEEELVFIGLNTADYYDRQIFAIAHELYHYYTKSGSHLSRLDDEDGSIIEAKANRFATELLLPEVVLKGIVLEEFRNSSIAQVSTKTLLRLVARLYCTWWLPYRAILMSLLEIQAISKKQYDELCSIDERDPNGDFSKIGRAVNEEIFSKLNAVTNTVGTSPYDIEIIIRNFEDNLIDEDMFADALSLFNKTPGDFGYEIRVSDEDLDELSNFLNGEGDDEG
jgi:Zn-dependent peptidase ImmA (M78 family)